MFLHITKDCNFVIFGDRLRHVFKPLVLYFSLCNADTPSTGYMQQPYCASTGSRYNTTKKPPGGLFISSTFGGREGGGSTEEGGAYLRGGLN